jgi:hypothetical protein
MRYVVAMVFAIVVAAVVTLKLSDPIATWGVSKMTFDSPDGADGMEALFYMATSFAGLVLGWMIGWLVGGPLHRVPRPD